MPFGDLARTVGRLRPEVDQALGRVLERGWFVLGDEVAAFETEFAAACGAEHAVGVGSGTDAIALALRAHGIAAGEEVVTTPVSAAFTALGVVMAGAVPVFADVDPASGLLDPASAQAAVTPRTRALLPVHLYGQAADMAGLAEVAREHDLLLIEDAAQAHGARLRGRPAGALADAAAFSFYPSKNLGAAGDGGAVVTSDREVAARVRRLRDGGQSDRFRHTERGVNSRLDELQAAFLRVRLAHLAADNERRAVIAARYDQALPADGRLQRPPVLEGVEPAHHLYTVCTAERPEFRRHMAAHGVATAVHYPTPIHRQPAFADTAQPSLPRAEAFCAATVSLPLFPELEDGEVDRIAAALASFGRS